jgi:multimeric flavodoxin WrbA
MKRMMVVSSSPRKDSNSEILADAVAAAAKKAGADVDKVRLTELKIGFCRGCDACQKSPETPCAQKDDMAGLLQRLRLADAIVLASPIYFFALSGQMKVFLDRTYALGGGGDFSALKGKAAAVVLTYGDADMLTSGALNALGTFRDAFSFLGIRNVGCVQASCSLPGGIRDNARALEEASDLGGKLAQFFEGGAWQ